MTEADQREAGKTGLPLEALRSLTMQTAIISQPGHVIRRSSREATDTHAIPVAASDIP